MHCPSCGTKCKSSKERCPRCGAPLDPKTAAFGGAARGVREAWGLEAREETAVRRRRLPRWAPVACGAGALAAAAGVAGVLALGGGAPAGVPLDANAFPDGFLAAALKACDGDGDGFLSDDELAAVTELDLSGLGLRSLEGLDVFKNLRVLDAHGNALESADLTGLDALERLDLSDNALATLDLSGHAALRELDVSDNGLGAVTLEGCSALERLSCSGNAIARLDVGGCTALTDLACDAGQNVTLPLTAAFWPDDALRDALASAADADADGALSQRERSAVTALDLAGTGATSLEGLAWFDNLARLDASGCQVDAVAASDLPGSLATLDLSGCPIASLDLAGCARLETLDVHGCKLTALDLASCTRLTSLDASDNQLAGTLDVRANTRLASLSVGGNASLSAVDARGVAGLAAPGAVACDVACTVTLADPETADAADAAAEPAADGEEVAEAAGEGGAEAAPAEG